MMSMLIKKAWCAVFLLGGRGMFKDRMTKSVIFILKGFSLLRKSLTQHQMKFNVLNSIQKGLKFLNPILKTLKCISYIATECLRILKILSCNFTQLIALTKLTNSLY